MANTGNPSLDSQSLLSTLQTDITSCQSMSNSQREKLLEEIYQLNKLIKSIYQISHQNQIYQGFEIHQSSDTKLNLIKTVLQNYLLQINKIEKSNDENQKTDTCRQKRYIDCNTNLKSLLIRQNEIQIQMQTIFEQSIIDSGLLNINPLFIRKKSKEQQNEGIDADYFTQNYNGIDSLNPPIEYDVEQNSLQNSNISQNRNNSQQSSSRTLQVMQLHRQTNNQICQQLIENQTKLYELFLNWQLNKINIELATTELYLQLCDTQNNSELNLKYDNLKTFFKDNKKKSEINL